MYSKFVAAFFTLSAVATSIPVYSQETQGCFAIDGSGRYINLNSLCSQTQSSQVSVDSTGLYSVLGTFTLNASNIRGETNDCYGAEGFDDIQAGMPVTIRDEAGKILATGYTGTGSIPSSFSTSVQQCVFRFTVANVPKANFYSIEVGRRGQLNYSFAQMQQRNWRVSLSLSQ